VHRQRAYRVESHRYSHEVRAANPCDSRKICYLRRVLYCRREIRCLPWQITLALLSNLLIFSLPI
jgi:hypothetical protein